MDRSIWPQAEPTRLWHFIGKQRRHLSALPSRIRHLCFLASAFPPQPQNVEGFLGKENGRIIHIYHPCPPPSPLFSPNPLHCLTRTVYEHIHKMQWVKPTIHLLLQESWFSGYPAYLSTSLDIARIWHGSVKWWILSISLGFFTKCKESVQNEIIQPKRVWERAEMMNIHLHQAIQQQIMNNYLSASWLSVAGKMPKRKRGVLPSAGCL